MSVKSLFGCVLYRSLCKPFWAVVKVVMCSRGGSASEVETHKNIDSVAHKNYIFKLTAYFPLAFKSRFMMKIAQETASRKRK